MPQDQSEPGTGLVRMLNESDFDAWSRLWRAYQLFYHVSIPAATSNVVWSRLLDPAEPMAGALGIIDGDRIGLVHYIRHRSCWTEGDYCYLQDLYVDAAVRGRGVGRKLIEHVYGEAAAMGCSRVYWLTHETNIDAMLLYNRIAERSGFIQYRKFLLSPTAASDDFDPAIQTECGARSGVRRQP